MAGTYACFYWSDWLSDPELRSCSPLARSLWMDMLCLAGVSVENRGFVVIGDKPASPAHLARLFGESVGVVEECLEELEVNGVFSRDRQGRIYSRRIVRDANRTKASSKGGKKGGATSFNRRTGIHSSEKKQENYNAVSAGNQSGIFTTPIPTCDSNTKSQRPKAKEEALPTNLKEAQERDVIRLAKLSQLLNIDYHRSPLGTAGHVRQIMDLEQAGVDIEEDLIPCIEALKVEGRGVEGKPIKYFRAIALDYRRAREIAAQVDMAIASAPVEETDAIGWKKRLDGWLYVGWWPAKFGPMPRTAQCCAPRALLDEALAQWARQGGHPQEGFCRALDRFVAWDRVEILRREQGVDYGDAPEGTIPLRKAVGG